MPGPSSWIGTADGWPTTTRIRGMKRERTALILAALVAVAAGAGAQPKPPRPPNVVLVYADDLGYGDIGVYGAPRIRTPHIDRLAAEGVRFTDFYVAQAVCSASRTALLTGAYPNRVGILGALFPTSEIGIADGETTLAEVLKAPRLRDRDLRQVAPRAPAALSPDAPRLRRLPRPPLLERHVAEPPGEDEVPAAAALLAGTPSLDAQPRPVAADRRVRPARRGLHRGEPRAPLLRLPRPHDAARADLRLRGASAGARSRASTAT